MKEKKTGPKTGTQTFKMWVNNNREPENMCLNESK